LYSDRRGGEIPPVARGGASNDLFPPSRDGAGEAAKTIRDIDAQARKNRLAQGPAMPKQSCSQG
jgi:hypothetical protein